MSGNWIFRCVPNSNAIFCRDYGPLGISFDNTVDPVYNDHPRNFEKWPLNTGGHLVQVGQKCPTGGRFGRA